MGVCMTEKRLISGLPMTENKPIPVLQPQKKELLQDRPKEIEKLRQSLLMPTGGLIQNLPNQQRQELLKQPMLSMQNESRNKQIQKLHSLESENFLVLILPQKQTKQAEDLLNWNKSKPQDSLNQTKQPTQDLPKTTEKIIQCSLGYEYLPKQALPKKEQKQAKDTRKQGKRYGQPLKDAIKASYDLQKPKKQLAQGYGKTKSHSVSNLQKRQIQNFEKAKQKRKQVLPKARQPRKKLLPKIKTQQKCIQCHICYEKTTQKQPIKLNCSHIFHKDCLLKSYEVKVYQRNFPLKCLDCNKQITHSVIKRILTDDLFALYERILLTNALLLDKHVFFCPTPDCLQSYEIIPSQFQEFECLGCKRKYCLFCHRPYHGKTECQVQKKQECSNDCRQCPKCHAGWFKTTGCNHVQCKVCQYSFCYKCGGEKCKAYQCLKEEGKRKSQNSNDFV